MTFSVKNNKKEVEEEKSEGVFEEIKKEETDDEILVNYLFIMDKSLMGFAPLRKFYLENKKSSRIYVKDNQYQLKLCLTVQLLEKIGCNCENLEETSNEMLQKLEFELPMMEDFKNVRFFLKNYRILIKIIDFFLFLFFLSNFFVFVIIRNLY